MRLKELRKKKGVTQKEVAEAVHCTDKAYSRYERGERQPSIEMLKDLSSYFNESIDYIVNNDTEVYRGC